MNLPFCKWLKEVKGKLVPDTRNARRAMRHRVVPRLEVLDDRIVPSTLTVTNNSDTGVSGDGSLRGEIAAARSGDTIQFAPSLAGQTITLTQGELAISKSLNIQGLGANQLSISGNNQSRVFDVTANNISVTIAGLTISDGLSSYGSGINNVGTLTVNDCTLSGNVAYYSDASSSNDGGAIENSGILTINNSTISDNKAVGRPGYDIYIPPPTSTTGASGGGYSGYFAPANALGGGIYTSGGTLSINSCTIADNEATGGTTGGYGLSAVGGAGYGGGLYVAGGTVAIRNSTLAGGESDYGGGIYNYAGVNPVKLFDAIIADNTAGAGADVEGSIISLGHNLISATTGGDGFVASDLLNVNPQLGPLQNNGGPTQTMALLPGSPAINTGDNTNAPAFDQRGPGFPRIVGPNVDVGAFEVQSDNSNQAHNLSVTGFPTVITAGTAGSFTVTALNADGSTDTGYNGTIQFTSSDGQAGLPADYTFTVADGGVHTFTTSANLKTAGTQSLTATDLIFGTHGTESGITVNAAAMNGFSVTAPTGTTAGSPFSVTLTARDAYNNIVASYAGTVHFSTSDLLASLPPDYTFTTTDAGKHTFIATLKRAGTQSITATDVSNPSFTVTDSGIPVNPGAASQFILMAPSSVTAGTAFSLTLTVEDAYGNVVTGYTGTVHFSSTDSRAKLPKSYTFTAADKGVHTFSGLILKTKGYQKITVTCNLNSSLTASDTVDVL